MRENNHYLSKFLNYNLGMFTRVIASLSLIAAFLTELPCKGVSHQIDKRELKLMAS
jgi:hypothetical protein